MATTRDVHHQQGLAGCLGLLEQTARRRPQTCRVAANVMLRRQFHSGQQGTRAVPSGLERRERLRGRRRGPVHVTLPVGVQAGQAELDDATAYQVGDFARTVSIAIIA